jgi:transposase
MSWKKLLESASESLNDHLRLRNDYLMAEYRILRNKIDGRVQLTDHERRELAEIGAKLGKQALAAIATVAQPDTILAWHRKFANQTVDTSAPPKSVGRPRVAPEIEEWVIRMARENRSWGYDRIQGSLKHLGYTISDQTVGNILSRHGIAPAPERKKTVTWGGIRPKPLARIIHQPAKSTGEVDFVVQMSDNSTVSRWMRLLNLSCQVVLTPSTSVG